MSTTRRLPPRVRRDISVGNRLNNTNNNLSKSDLIKYMKNRAKTVANRYNLYNYMYVNNMNRNFENIKKYEMANRVGTILYTNLNRYNTNQLRLAANHLKGAAQSNASYGTARGQMRNVESSLQ